MLNLVLIIELVVYNLLNIIVKANNFYRTHVLFRGEATPFKDMRSKAYRLSLYAYIMDLGLIPASVKLVIDWDLDPDAGFDARALPGQLILNPWAIKSHHESSIVKLVKHELTHVNQFDSGRMVYNFVENFSDSTITWEGKTKTFEGWFVPSAMKHTVAGKIFSRLQYLVLPWEVEAHGHTGFMGRLSQATDMLFSIHAVLADVLAK